MPVVYQNQKLVFTPEDTFDNALLLLQYISSNFGGAALDSEEGYLPNINNVRIGEKVYYLGYAVDFPFNPYEFFVFEGVKDRDWGGHPMKYHTFHVVDFEEGGVAFFWYDNLESGKILYTHMTDDEYAVLQQQKVATINDVWNAFSILEESIKRHRVRTDL